jgi:hypothetical protein
MIPKTITYEYQGQRYTCQYDPKAPTDKCWVWYMYYTRVYTYVGSAATSAIAIRQAKRKIDALTKRQQVQDEENVE